MLTSTSIIWASSCGLCGLLMTLILTPFIRRWAITQNLLDRMGQFHMTHAMAVPRLGGLGIVMAFLLILVLITYAGTKDHFAFPEEAGVMFLTCLAMFTLGFWDDLRPLGAKVKLAFQILIASLAVMGGMGIGQWVNPYTHAIHVLGIWDAPITIFWIVAVTNLINLIDGLDGLAAGAVLLLMALLATVSAMSGNLFSLFLTVGMVGALLGFLYYNFPPAKIFMGDGGSYFLGALIAELALVNSRKGEVAAALIAPFFALGLPLIDASFTIIRRGLVGLPIFRADRKHIHHRLAGMGFSQGRVVLALYALCGFFAMLALGAFVSKGRLLPVLFGIFMIVAILSARAFGFVQDWYKFGRLLAESLIRRKHTKYALLLGEVLLLEAERCKSMDELWKNFEGMLEKLGFWSVILRQGSEERRWKARDVFTPEQGVRLVRYETKACNPSCEMQFYCEPHRLDEETTRLLSELAAEAWTKSSSAWHRMHPAAP